MYIKSIFLLITIMTFVALKPVKSVSPFVFYAFHFASMHVKIFIIVILYLKFPLSFFRVLSFVFEIKKKRSKEKFSFSINRR